MVETTLDMFQMLTTQAHIDGIPNTLLSNNGGTYGVLLDDRLLPAFKAVVSTLGAEHGFNVESQRQGDCHVAVFSKKYV